MHSSAHSWVSATVSGSSLALGPGAERNPCPATTWEFTVPRRTTAGGAGAPTGSLSAGSVALAPQQPPPYVQQAHWPPQSAGHPAVEAAPGTGVASAPSWGHVGAKGGGVVQQAGVEFARAGAVAPASDTPAAAAADDDDDDQCDEDDEAEGGEYARLTAGGTSNGWGSGGHKRTSYEAASSEPSRFADYLLSARKGGLRAPPRCLWLLWLAAACALAAFALGTRWCVVPPGYEVHTTTSAFQTPAPAQMQLQQLSAATTPCPSPPVCEDCSARPLPPPPTCPSCPACQKVSCPTHAPLIHKPCPSLHVLSPNASLAEVSAFNHHTVESVSEWIQPPHMKASFFSYGIPDSILAVLNKHVGDAPQQADVITMLGLQMAEPLNYLEIGVSAGKTFYTQTQAFAHASLVAFDIEYINPTLELLLQPRTRHLVKEWDKQRLDALSGGGSPRSGKVNRLTRYHSNNDNVVHFVASDEFDQEGWAAVASLGLTFNLLLSDALHRPTALDYEWRSLLTHGLLSDSGQWCIVWDDLLPDLEAAWRSIVLDAKKQAETRYPKWNLQSRFFEINGWVGQNEGKHRTGVLCSNVDLEFLKENGKY